MEIALPHVISHAKAFLSTFKSFASFTIKRIHGVTAEMNTFSPSDRDRQSQGL